MRIAAEIGRVWPSRLLGTSKGPMIAGNEWSGAKWTSMNSQNRSSKLFSRTKLHTEEKLLEVGSEFHRIEIQEAEKKKV